MNKDDKLDENIVSILNLLSNNSLWFCKRIISLFIRNMKVFIGQGT